MKKPNVSPEDWITIGSKDVVVCNVFQECPPDIEVVFFDNRNRPTNKVAKWVNDHWEFDEPSGGLANQNPMLSEFVSILRRGRRPHLRHS